MQSSRKKKNENIKFVNACVFCGLDEKDEVVFGKNITTDAICMHTNCLFFASGLPQRGTNITDEFLGFTLDDIKAEVRRGRKLICYYCKKRGATIGCCILKCKRSFHLNCGVQNGTLHEFFGSFCSYCKDHKPKQKPLVIPDDFYCFICCESILDNEVESCIYPPCCKKNLLHKTCIQKYALSAGLFYCKCPFCNDKSSFLHFLQKYGINVPERDASWELESNAFEDLLARPECNASVCSCPNGRKHDALRKGGWSLMTCYVCGFYASHRKCSNINYKVNEWMCSECKSVRDNVAQETQCSHPIEKFPPVKNESKSTLPEIISYPSTSKVCLSLKAPKPCPDIIQSTKNSSQTAKYESVLCSNEESEDVVDVWNKDCAQVCSVAHEKTCSQIIKKFPSGNTDSKSILPEIPYPSTSKVYWPPKVMKNYLDVIQSTSDSSQKAEACNENLHYVLTSDEEMCDAVDPLSKLDDEVLNSKDIKKEVLKNMEDDLSNDDIAGESQLSEFNLLASCQLEDAFDEIIVPPTPNYFSIPKVGDQVPNLKDIKNVPHTYGAKQLKFSRKKNF